MPGAPYRKTNIYDEGNLIALMLDVMIMEATDNKQSLKDVCLKLYNEFGKKNRGYSYDDIIRLAELESGRSFKTFFDTYVASANDFEEALVPCFEYLGLKLEKIDNPLLCERNFGFKTIDNGTFARVSLVAPYSPAWKAGLFANDDVIAVNGTVVRNNLNSLLVYNQNETKLELTVISNEKVKTILVETDQKGRTWFFKSKVATHLNQTERQKANFKVWKAN